MNANTENMTKAELEAEIEEMVRLKREEHERRKKELGIEDPERPQYEFEAIRKSLRSWSSGPKIQLPQRVKRNPEVIIAPVRFQSIDLLPIVR